jgi:hypothetical protein
MGRAGFRHVGIIAGIVVRWATGSSMDDFWTTPIVVPTKRIGGLRGEWQARMGLESVGKKAPLVLLTTEVGW